jgi:predicted small integral membrane protein
MEQQNTEHPRLELSSQLVTIMTTEHYNLRMALSMNTTEISGRSSLFVGAVSSALIALAFVGQVSHLGTAFFVFGLVVLAALVVMGLITFERVLESSNTQFMYARGINRIRHLYLEYAPQMRPYFILSSHDDVEGTLADMGVMHSSGWQGFFSLAGMVAMITSVLAGSFVGLLLAAFSLPLVVTVSAGVVAFLVSVGLHQLYQWRNWLRLGRDLPARFPGKTGQ